MLTLAWSPDGKYLISGSFREVTLWDLESKEPKHRLSGFADKVVALAWSPDGTLLVVDSLNFKVKRFGAFKGRRRNWKKAYVSLKPGQELNFATEA